MEELAGMSYEFKKDTLTLILPGEKETNKFKVNKNTPNMLIVQFKDETKHEIVKRGDKIMLTSQKKKNGKFLTLILKKGK